MRSHDSRDERLAWKITKGIVLINLLLLIAVLICVSWGIMRSPLYAAASSDIHVTILKPLER